MEGKPWRIESPGASITDNVEQATLALRLGIAVNAMRAVQKFFYNFRDAPGPAGERDRLWAFLIAMGYLKEAIELLRPKVPVIRECFTCSSNPRRVVILETRSKYQSGVLGAM